MKNKKIKTKFFCSIGMMIAMIFMLLIMFGIVIQTFYYINYIYIQKLSIISYFLLIFFCIILPIIIFVFTAPRWFSIVEINEKGVKRTLFGSFCKREISWNDMEEIRLYKHIASWLFFSKKSLDGIVYEYIVKSKEVIAINPSKRIIETIELFYPKKIINYNKQG